MTEPSGNPSGAEPLHIGIAVADWNSAITDLLLRSAQERLEALSVPEVTVLRVPGAFELPLGAKALAENGCDGVVAVGAVVKGATDHYEIIVRESSAGVAAVALETGIPVTNAILAVRNYEDAVERSGEGASNKGAEAADAVVDMINALRGLRGA